MLQNPQTQAMQSKNNQKHGTERCPKCLKFYAGTLSSRSFSDSSSSRDLVFFRAHSVETCLQKYQDYIASPESEQPNSGRSVKHTGVASHGSAKRPKKSKTNW
jgi:hypothetical protein